MKNSTVTGMAYNMEDSNTEIMSSRSSDTNFLELKVKFLYMTGSSACRAFLKNFLFI
jgi:hypothetical protein